MSSMEKVAHGCMDVRCILQYIWDYTVLYLGPLSVCDLYCRALAKNSEITCSDFFTDSWRLDLDHFSDRFIKFWFMYWFIYIFLVHLFFQATFPLPAESLKYLKCVLSDTIWFFYSANLMFLQIWSESLSHKVLYWIYSISDMWTWMRTGCATFSLSGPQKIQPATVTAHHSPGQNHQSDFCSLPLFKMNEWSFEPR